MKIIDLLLGGGLGNQMFQYAFARSLALRSDENILLRISRYDFRNNPSGRDYSLNKLNLPDNIKLMTNFQEFLTRKKFNFTKEFYRLKHGFELHDFYTDSVIFIEDFDKFVPELVKNNFIKKNLIISGGFQAWKYFSDCAPQIREELKVRTPPSDKNAKIIKELESCESVCVHVRRGDYLALNWNKVCDYEYYDRAIKYILNKVKSPVFYFFSNTHEDIEWLKNNWSFPYADIKYIDFNNPDYEELRLMYSCKHFVIANSSFSWWGSYLSDNTEKIICAPSKWIDERPIEKLNLFMPDWKIIHDD